MHTAQDKKVASPTDSIKPIRGDAFGYAQARHLLLRAGFAGTDEQIRTLARWGPEKAVDHLVNYESIPAPAAAADAFDSGIMRPLSTEERRAVGLARQRGDEDTVARFRTERQRRQREDRRQMREVQRDWLTRMVQTPRPLEEKMTLFWHGHFATSFRIVEDSYHMYMQNRLLRGNAMGNFGSMLRGIIRDPAMLKYLNNNQNRKSSPNENLGRELLELFTLGEGNYTERDIKEAARTLTGFTYEDDQFVFQERNHDEGTKYVLGVQGNIDGDSLISAILKQRACALFICFKLYKYFVRDIPMDLSALDLGTRKVILALSTMFRKNNYEIKPIIHKLLLSEHMYDEHNMGNKIKSPSELLIGSIRSLRVPVRDMGVVSEAMDLMGQSLYYPPSVKGWDGGRSWINTSTMFVRQNTLAYLITGALPNRSIARREKTTYDATSIVPSLNRAGDETPSDQKIVSELASLTLGSRDSELVDSVHRGAVSGSDMQDPDAVNRALVILTSMPEYQLC